MRLLFFCPRDCRPPNTGAKLRNFHLCRELSKEFDVTFLGFADEENPPPSPEVAQKIITLPHPGHKPMNLVRGVQGKVPYTVLNYTTPKMGAELTRLLREQTFDFVQVESLLLAEYLYHFNTAHPQPIVTCDWHNVDSEVLERYAEHAPNLPKRLYAKVTAKRMAALERATLQFFNAHFTVSDRDRDHILKLSPATRVHTVENGVDTPAFEGPRSPNPHRIVFVGSMDYHPNVDAATYFAAHVWPQVRAQRPTWVFTIVGRSPAPAVQALAELPNVEVTGTVDDVRPYYREAVAAVVPLRVGGGSRLKILEAMAARVPVVSTTLGAEGLAVVDGKSILIRDKPEQMAYALIDLARPNPALVENALALAVSRYDWSAVGTNLRAIYADLAAKRQAVPA